MTAPKTTNIDSIDELEGLLSGLDTTVEKSDEQIEEIISAADAAIDSGIDELDLSEEELRSVDASFVREEAYAEQESTVDTAAPKKGKKATVQKAAKTPAEKKEAAPRVVRDLNALDPKVFVLEGSTELPEADLAKIKVETIALSPSQKKIAEKFENLFSSIASDRMPSTFIMQAFMLLDHTGTLSSSDLVAAYKTKGAKSADEGYNEGTARSQAGQIMHLFEVVKVAERTKQSLSINKNSNVAAKLRALVSKATKTDA